MCGKLGHHAPQCRHGKRNGNLAKPNANLVEADIIAAVFSPTNMIANIKGWMVDSSAIKHVHGN